MAALSNTVPAAINISPSILDQIEYRQTCLHTLPPHLQTAEKAILEAVSKAVKNDPTAWTNYIEALQANPDEVPPPSLKISAAAGCTMIVKVEDQCVVLLGKLNKPGKREHETFSTLSGKVEPRDLRNPKIPVCVAAAARETGQESHQVVPEQEVSDFLLDPAPVPVQMLPNPGWKNYPTAVFAAMVSKPTTPDAPSKFLEKLNQTAAGKPNAEITGYAWVPLTGLLQKHEEVVEQYNKRKEELRSLYPAATDAEFDEICKKDSELVAVYNTQVEMLAETAAGVYIPIKVNDGARRTFAESRESIEAWMKATS